MADCPKLVIPLLVLIRALLNNRTVVMRLKSFGCKLVYVLNWFMRGYAMNLNKRLIFTKN